MRPERSAGTIRALIVAALVLSVVGPVPARADDGPPARQPMVVAGPDDARRPNAALPESDRRPHAAAARARGAADEEELLHAIDARQRAALRSGGWAVPAKLAASWVLRRARVLDGEPDTLQLVYSRGGATLSVFQRAAPVDWSRLPTGSVEVPELRGTVREWPRAKPGRLVWQAGERAFVVVGDVDRAGLLEVAEDLPPAAAESGWQRLRRGLSTLVRRFTP